MSQIYHRLPSEIYQIEGAAGYFFDVGLFIFGRWVESECQEAERRGTNEMFARSNRQRTFARCMGDDMETSSVGFADPFVTGVVETATRKRRVEKSGDEILWSESS